MYLTQHIGIYHREASSFAMLEWVAHHIMVIEAEARVEGENGKHSKERTCREDRRRSRVIGVFPAVKSWVRLVTCYLTEYTENWGVDRSYIKMEEILVAMEINQDFPMAQTVS